jgi:hypothetical protein
VFNCVNWRVGRAALTNLSHKKPWVPRDKSRVRQTKRQVVRHLGDSEAAPMGEAADTASPIFLLTARR